MALQNVGTMLNFIAAGFLYFLLGSKQPFEPIIMIAVILIGLWITLVGVVSLREKGVFYQRRGVADFFSNLFTIIVGVMALGIAFTFFVQLLFRVELVPQILAIGIGGIGSFKEFLLVFALLGYGPALIGVAMK